MKKFVILLAAALACSSCVSMPKASLPDEELEKIVPAKEEQDVAVDTSPPALQNIKGEELEEYVQKKGVIFAKTEFKGLLETRYVKFLFEDQEDPVHKFQLHIGESSG